MLAIATYATYGGQIYHGRSVPNPATWLVWLGLGTLNTVTYFLVLRRNWYECLISIVVTLCLAVLFGYSLFFGKFSVMSQAEKYYTVAVAATVLTWFVTGNARIANGITQVLYLTSYVPTVIGIRRGSAREAPAAWVLATCAYAAATLAVLSNFNGDWLTLFYPFVTGVLGNATIATLASSTRHTKINDRRVCARSPRSDIRRLS